MVKYITNLYYVLLIFPAYSISQIILGIHTQNRILWIPLGLLMILFTRPKKIDTYQIVNIVLTGYFITYIFLAILNGWDIYIYLGYVLTSLLLIISCHVVELDKIKFVEFFKLFFLMNISYAILQMVFLNIGMGWITMVHSNLPAQVNYEIPIFLMEPLYRITGLFNESSPFAFYLSIAFVFFLSLGREFKTFKILSAFFLLISGSKFAYIFILLHFSLFSRSKTIKSVVLFMLCIFLYLFFCDFERLLLLTNGEVASLGARLLGFDFDGNNEIKMFGSGLGKSSEGEVALNMFAILFSGFGYTSLFIYGFMGLFYKLINSEQKKYFIIPFAVATLSNGSILTFQYTLLISCLVYLHKNQLRKGLKSDELL